MGSFRAGKNRQRYCGVFVLRRGMVVFRIQKTGDPHGRPVRCYKVSNEGNCGFLLSEFLTKIFALSAQRTLCAGQIGGCAVPALYR